MKTIGIYPGNFQPPHRGHLNVYKKLKHIVGTETFVATTSKTPTPDAPLHLGEKENIWVRHGVSADRIEKVDDWKHPTEIFKNFSPKHTSAIFMLNDKEFQTLYVKKGMLDDKPTWLNADNTPNYFQSYKGNEHDMESLDKHGYVIIMEDNNIDGKPVSTANIRAGLGSPKYTEEQKRKFFQWAFGWFDIGLFQELTSKFKMAHSTIDSEEEPTTLSPMPTLASLVKPNQPSPSIAPKVDKSKEKLQQTIKEMVKEMLQEILPPTSTPSGTDTTMGMDTELPDAGERRKDVMKNRQDASKMKRAAERDLKTMEADLKWKKADVERKRRDELPAKRKELSALNKSISSGIPPQ